MVAFLEEDPHAALIQQSAPFSPARKRAPSAGFAVERYGTGSPAPRSTAWIRRVAAFTEKRSASKFWVHRSAER